MQMPRMHTASPPTSGRYSLDLSPDKDHRKDYTPAPTPSGEHWAGTPTVCVSAGHRCGWRGPLPPSQIPWAPGEHREHCESQVLWLLQCSQHNPSLLREKLEGAGVDCHLAAWTINYLTTACEALWLCVGCSSLQHRSPSRNRAFSFPVHHIYIRLRTQHRQLSYPEVLRWHSHRARRLRRFGVCRTLLRSFYDTVVASSVFYANVCWGCGCTERDRKRLNKVVERASSVLDSPLDPTMEVGERRMLAKLNHGQNLSPPPSYRGGP